MRSVFFFTSFFSGSRGGVRSGRVGTAVVLYDGPRLPIDAGLLRVLYLLIPDPSTLRVC